MAAGWTIADLVYALDHTPDGAQRWYTSPIRHPGGWLRARLGDWRGADGSPRPAHSAQLAAVGARWW